jgi:hypothetical protein
MSDPGEGRCDRTTYASKSFFALDGGSGGRSDAQ